MTQATKSALSSARERFLAGLERRGEELRPLIAAFSSDPAARVPRAELQRRLHALLASAQLFEESALVESLQRLTGRLDEVGLGGEPWRAADRELLFSLLTRLGARADGLPLMAAEAPARTSDVVASGKRPSTARPGFAASTEPVRPPPSAVLLTRVLLVCSRPHAASLRGVLDDAPIELLHAADPEQALAILQSASPTCALLAVEFATLPDINLVRSLQSDPQSRLGGVYLLLPAGSSYDAEFVRQTGADGVLIEPISWQSLSPFLERASERRGWGGLRALGERPEGTVEEIASFFAEEVRSGLLSALRDETTERIRLPDTRELSEVARSAIDRAKAHLAGHGTARPPAAAGEPVAADEPSAEAVAEAVRVLTGKRVLVVDDDPAVLWFLSGLLREAGANVLSARDGREALDLARRKRPQVVISDILMPKMDGFAMCRELRRDVLLARVPVILLTWKDDQLVRSAGIAAGPTAYLRKEAGGGEVLTALAEALAPHQQLMAAAADPGAIAGVVDELGIAALLECVALSRPNARVRVEDSSRLFEVDIRDGQRLTVTKTAADGSFTRGERALIQLLGVKNASYSVLTQSGSLRSPLAEPLSRALQSAGRELSVVFEAVSDERLPQVALLSFDEALLAVWAEHMPAELRELVECFKTPSNTARKLLDSGRYQPAQLEGYLRELAAYGVITGVWDGQGADLIAQARRSRSLGPPSSTLPTIPRTELDAASAARALPEAQPAADSGAIAAVSSVAPTPVAESGGAAAAALEPAPAALSFSSVLAEPDWSDARAPDEDPALPLTTSDPMLDVLERFSVPTVSASVPPPLPERGRNALRVAGAAVKPALAKIRTARREALRLGLSLAALAALGYVGGMLLEDPSGLLSRRGAPQRQQIAQVAPAAAHETSLRSGTDPGLALGTVLPYVDTSRGVAVGSDEGLVVIEYRGSGTAPVLEIDRHALQAPPVALALPAGVHELTLRSGTESTTYSLAVHAGETRIIPLP